MKILLDECIDRRFARDLVGHEVTTVPKCGWAGIKNGELLARAEKEFRIFVTVDRKLAMQQDLSKFDIAVILIRARSNRLKDLRWVLPALVETINRAPVRALTTIGL